MPAAFIELMLIVALIHTDPVVSTLMSEYRDVFSGLGKHKHIKAKLIVDESIQTVAHRQRRIPYNLGQKAAHEELS